VQVVEQWVMSADGPLCQRARVRDPPQHPPTPPPVFLSSSYLTLEPRGISITAAAARGSIGVR
jgi:hypothetical protein